MPDYEWTSPEHRQSTRLGGLRDAEAGMMVELEGNEKPERNQKA